MSYPYPTYQQPPPGRPVAPKRPSLVPVVLGAMVLGASIVVGLLLLTTLATIARTDRVQDFARFAVDGGATGEVDVKRTGLYTIYYEFQGEIDGDDVDAEPDPPADLELRVSDDRDDDVGVRELRQQFEFDAAGRRGVPVAQVELEETGDYTIEADGGDEVYGIAMGRGILDQDLTDDATKRAGLAVLVLGGLAGLALTLWGLARNSRARRRPSSSAGGYGQGGYPGSPYGGYPGQQQGWAPAPPPQSPPGPAPGGWDAPRPPGSQNPPFPGPS